MHRCMSSRRLLMGRLNSQRTHVHPRGFQRSSIWSCIAHCGRNCVNYGAIVLTCKQYSTEFFGRDETKAQCGYVLCGRGNPPGSVYLYIYPLTKKKCIFWLMWMCILHYKHMCPRFCTCIPYTRIYHIYSLLHKHICILLHARRYPLSLTYTF